MHQLSCESWEEKFSKCGDFRHLLKLHHKWQEGTLLSFFFLFFPYFFKHNIDLCRYWVNPNTDGVWAGWVFVVHTDGEETEKILLLYKHCAYSIKKRVVSGDNVGHVFRIVDKNSCFGTCFGRLYERLASWRYFTSEWIAIWATRELRTFIYSWTVALCIFRTMMSTVQKSWGKDNLRSGLCYWRFELLPYLLVC